MSREPSAIDDKGWERLRYRGAPVKQHVLADLPDSGALLLGDRMWQSFKQHCAAEGNVVPLLIAQLEPQDPDPGMFRRRGPRKPAGSDPFGDLPLLQRLEAEQRFRRLCEKWVGNLPSWRRAILAGVARRLTLHPPGPEWGRRMRRIKGGVHCQRKYREVGWHPLTAFNQAMAKRREADEAARDHGPDRGANRSLSCAQEARRRLGITPEHMRGIPRMAPILECAEGGVKCATEALRWSREEDALAFLRKYDSIPPTDLGYLSIDEICAAAAVDPRRLLRLAVDCIVKISLMETTLIVSTSQRKIARRMIKSALTDNGARDRRLFFDAAGILPSRHGPGLLATVRNTGARRTEAQPATRPAESPGAMAQPWLRTLPGKGS